MVPVGEVCVTISSDMPVEALDTRSRAAHVSCGPVCVVTWVITSVLAVDFGPSLHESGGGKDPVSDPPSSSFFVLRELNRSPNFSDSPVVSSFKPR